MSNFITSQIRTWTPIAIGALVSWLALKGIELDAETQAGLIVALTGVLQAIYYTVARLIEQKWPHIGGLLLGSTKTPDYEKVN